MSKIKGLFQKAWTAVTNPGQDERVQVILQAIHRGFREQKQAFNLEQILEPIECTVKDVEVATRQYYASFVGRYWTSGIPDDKQLKMIAWVAANLKLNAEDIAGINLQVAETAFGVRLADALSDGVITKDELSELSKIAAFARMPLGVFIKRGWSDQSLGMLRSIFVEATETGFLSEALWNNLVQSARVLGISQEELLQSVVQIGQSFAEHVLADAKSDGHISHDEERYLCWLLTTLNLSHGFRDYVHAEIIRVKNREQIANGHVPSLRAPSSLNLEAGELLHFNQPASLILTKVRRSGDLDMQAIEGRLYLTDKRVIFASSEKPLSFLYKSIVSHHGLDRYFRMQVKGKPEIVFSFDSAIDNAGLILDVVVKQYSQRITRKVEGGPDRHIPRDVRQRVWQTYGGKCADCGATEYLEFDHIIPHAKGGSNDERNVQLLCRKCNNAKSDKI